MQEESISQDFLSCLISYRRNALLYKSFQAWKSSHILTNKQIKRSILSLEIWSQRRMSQCFWAWKSLRGAHRENEIPYRLGKYLIYWAVHSLLPRQSLGLFKSRIDKLVTLLIEYAKTDMNMPKVRAFIKEWEYFLKKRYFNALWNNYIKMQKYRIRQKQELKRKYFKCMKLSIRNKKIIYHLKRIFKFQALKLWSETARDLTLDYLKENLADKFMKKIYQRKSFNAVKEHRAWRQEARESEVAAIRFYIMRRLCNLFYYWRDLSSSKKVSHDKKQTAKVYQYLRLAFKGFNYWKKITKKFKALRENSESYSDYKKLKNLTENFNNWKFIFLAKRKIEQFYSIVQKSRSMRALKKYYLKKKRLHKIEQVITHFRQERVITKAMQAWKIFHEHSLLLNRRLNEMENDRYLFQLRSVFNFWKEEVIEKNRIKFTESASDIFRSSSYIKNFFTIWRSRIGSKAHREKMKVLATSKYENYLLKVGFKGFRHYLDYKVKKRAKQFTCLSFYENKLMSSFVNRVKTILNNKAARVSHSRGKWAYKVVSGFFNFLRSYSIQKNAERNMLKCMAKNRTDRRYVRAFYYLKQRTADNRVYRRYQALAKITHDGKVYTKTFKAWKKFQVLLRISKKFSNKISLKVKKSSYSIWKNAFKQEKLLKGTHNAKKIRLMIKHFGKLKRYYLNKKKSRTIVKDFRAQKEARFLFYPFLLWKNLIYIKKQQVGLHQALVVKHYVKQQVRIMQSWRQFAHQHRALRLAKQAYEDGGDSRLMTKFFKIWLEKAKPAIEEASLTNAALDEMRLLKLKKIMMILKIRTKNKVIRKRLFDLWTEKKISSLLLKSLTGWKNHVIRKTAGAELADFKVRKNNLKLMRGCFLLLQIYKEKRKQESLFSTQIRLKVRENVQRKFFIDWCEAYRDVVFDMSIAPMVDKYQKLLAFRQFSRKVQEHSEMTGYYKRLSLFATEVRKKKAFLDFMEKLADKRITRITVEQKEKQLKFHLKRKRFDEFRMLLQPDLEKVHGDMQAIKFYVISLYKRFFRKWREHVYRNLSSERGARAIESNILKFFKRKFFTTLHNVSEEMEVHGNIIRRHRKVKRFYTLKRCLYGWRRVVLHKKQLEILSDEYRHANDKFLRKSIFSLWFRKAAISSRTKHLIAAVLENIYQNRLGEAFMRLKAVCNQVRTNDENFDKINERYVASLLKTSFEQWKEIFEGSKLSNRMNRKF